MFVRDMTVFRTGNNDNANDDEIQNYQSARWISPPEAPWRPLGFDLYDMHPPV